MEHLPENDMPMLASAINFYCVMRNSTIWTRFATISTRTARHWKRNSLQPDLNTTNSRKDSFSKR